MIARAARIKFKNDEDKNFIEQVVAMLDLVVRAHKASKEAGASPVDNKYKQDVMDADLQRVSYTPLKTSGGAIDSATPIRVSTAGSPSKTPLRSSAKKKRATQFYEVLQAVELAETEINKKKDELFA